MAKIDVNRCLRAMKNIRVCGLPTGSVRLRAIEDAITRIVHNPKQALSNEYIGVKVYAGFGDQREDHKYGYGPRHGHIVFSIKRHESCKKLGEDEIYLLEAVRDAGQIDIGVKDKYRNTVYYNLCDVLDVLVDCEKKLDIVKKAIDEIEVEAHV